MNKIINLYNEIFVGKHSLEYPKTDLQILKTYKYLSSIPNSLIQNALKDIKLPKIDSWRGYFCLNMDGNEYYIIDLTVDIEQWNLDEIEKAIRKGKVILAENDEGMTYLVKNITLDLKNKKISLETMDNTYSTILK